MKKYFFFVLYFFLSVSHSAQNLTLGDLITLVNYENYYNVNSFLKNKGWEYEEKSGSESNEDLRAIWAYERSTYYEDRASSWFYWGYEKMLGYGTYYISIDIFESSEYLKIHNSLSAYGFKYDNTDVDNGDKTVFYKNDKYNYVEIIKSQAYSSDKTYSLYLFWKSEYSPDNNGKKTIYYENSTKVKEEYTLNKGILDGSDQFYAKDGSLLISGYYKNGKKNGHFKFYTEKGKLDFECDVKDDSLHGEYTSYFDNGKVRSIDHYYFGTLHGDFKYYHDKGYLMVDGTYNNDKLDGVLKEFDENGLIAIKTYKLDSLHGKYVEYYKNGNIIVETNYNNGQIHGKYNEYHENGKKKTETNYINGKVNGKYSSWNEDGTIDFITTVQNDIQNGIKQLYFYMNDSIYFIHYGKMKDDKMEGRWEGIFVNSNTGKEKIFTFTNYKNGVENGPFMEFSNDSLIYGNYLDGEIDGPYQQYYDMYHFLVGGLNFSDTTSAMCILMSKGNYRKGKKSGNWSYYSINERLSSCGNYIDGKKDGHWKFYNTTEHEFVTPDSTYSKDFGHLLLFEAEFKNDLFDGIFRQYYIIEDEVFQCKDTHISEDSCVSWSIYKVDLTCNYSNDKLNGSYLLMNDIGETIFSGNYKNGLKDGMWFETRYYEIDTNFITLNYQNGLKEGEIESYKTNGDLEVKGYYKKDKQDGLWEYYNENKKSQEITFKNDIRHGPSRFFSPTGEVIFYHNYINDEIDSTAAYNWEESPGELSYTIKVISKSKHEFRIRRTELYNDNSTTTTYLVENENLDIFQTGIKDGSFSIKVKDELFVEGTYYDNLKSGLWIQYFYDLDLAYSSKWSADEIESEEFYNIGTNQPVSGKFRIHNYFNPGTEEVVKINNGIRHGKTIIYKDGVKLAVRKYKNGVLVK